MGSKEDTTVETSRQVSERWNPVLAPWQHDVNEEWIEHTWSMLNMGGIWGYEMHALAYKKVEGGWELQETIALTTQETRDGDQEESEEKDVER